MANFNPNIRAQWNLSDLLTGEDTYRVAREAGVSVDLIEQARRGQRVSDEELVALADALGVPVEAIWQPVGHMTPPPPDEGRNGWHAGSQDDRA